MTEHSGPPPFRKVGFRAEPIDPERFNAEQEFERGRACGFGQGYIVGRRDAMRELRESVVWLDFFAKLDELNESEIVRLCAERLRKRVEGGG